MTPRLMNIQADALRVIKAAGLHDKGWTFGWHNSRTKYGRCSYSWKSITLSCDLTPGMTDEEVRDILLHEVAHAIAGPNEGHGLKFQTICRILGCSWRPRQNAKERVAEAREAKWIDKIM